MGFRKHSRHHNKNNSFYKKYWFLIWVVVYGVLYYLSTLLANLIGITNIYYNIILIGVIISLFVRIISCSIHKHTFHLGFNLLIWTLIYILLLFGMKSIITYFTLNIWQGIILIALGYTILIHFIKKINFSFLTFVSIILFIFIFLLSSGYNLADVAINEEQVDSNQINNNSIVANDSQSTLHSETAFNSRNPQCIDGTDYNSCSSNKPNYCKDGNLIEIPVICGCADGFTLDGDNCVSVYYTNPKDVTLDYILRGKKSNIDYTVYGGLNDYLVGLDRVVWYSIVPPTDEYMTLRFVTEEHQSKYISPLAEKIKQITDNTDDQARIAISIVQTMPYDWDSFSNGSDNRYAYETLYDQTGVCADKTSLLAVLLKELGYGVVIFNFSSESHEAIGIKCPMEYSYLDSGYCFVEATTPSIITDSQGDYVGVGKLTSTPEIYTVADGKSFDSVTEEYKDYQTYLRVTSKGQTLNEVDYATWKRITDKYGFRFD